MADQQAKTMKALNILGKWRTLFTGWQLGTRPKGDPEGDAVRDHRERDKPYPGYKQCRACDATYVIDLGQLLTQAAVIAAVRDA